MAHPVLVRPRDENLLFPQEIIDATIDFLEGDGKSLAAAGLVERSWYQRTRVHLFREIAFRGMSVEVRSVEFKQLIEASPTLVQCIEQLTLGLVPVPSDIAHAIAVTPLLTSLTGVTVVSQDWALLSDELETSLLELMSNPRVRKVALIDVMNVDISPFSQFRNLKELILSSITSPKPRISLRDPPSPKDRLRVNCDGQFLKMLISCPDGTLDIFHPTTLDMVTTDYDYGEEEIHLPALERCGVLVESYYLAHRWRMFPRSAFALRCFPKLKYFSVSLLYNDNPLHILLEELDYLSQSDTPRNLSKIGFEFKLAVEGDTNLQTIADYEFWPRLNAFLEKPAFSRLRILIITFDTTFIAVSNVAWERTKAKILATMSNLRTCPGIVQISKYRES